MLEEKIPETAELILEFYNQYVGKCLGMSMINPNSGYRDITFSDDAPEYRICSPGVNVEGVCTNKGCTDAYGKMVIHRF